MTDYTPLGLKPQPPKALHRGQSDSSKASTYSPVRPCPILPGFALPYPALPCSILPSPAQSYPTQSRSILPNLVPPSPALLDCNPLPLL